MIPRLYYVTTQLKEGEAVPLLPNRVHYLKNVLRRKPGDKVLLFNGDDGEFDAEIVSLEKKSGTAKLLKQTRAPRPEPDLWLIFAGVKRAAQETIVQKATELGAAYIVPVKTERTVTTKVNRDRLALIALEATEQCDRLTLPNVQETQSLEKVLADWPADRRLIYCDEAGDDPNAQWGGEKGRAAPVLETLNKCASKSDKWAILIGPEGGFSPAERELLRAKPFVTPVSLGPRILRADTAAIAALTLWQAALGDWRAEAVTPA